MNITKSLYVAYTQCPALVWNDLFNPLPDNADKSRAQEGERVGIFARDYFNNWELFDLNNPQTKPGVYAEYVFKYKDTECRVDMLVINNDKTIDIYEVKSVNDVDKDKYLEDISFQYYVVSNAVKGSGLKVKSANLMCFNRDYVYDGKQYDLKQLFKVSDMTDVIINRLTDIENNINSLRLLNSNSCPKCPLTGNCKEQHTVCRYLDRCKAMYGLPKEHSAFELYGNANKMKLIEEGLLTWGQIYSFRKIDLSDFNKTMIECFLNNINHTICKKGYLEEFLNKIVYPVYFFDFEGVQETIPVYPNSKPYEQIPFQYSLHISESINDTEEDIVKRHKEFLGDGIDDPRKDLIEQMINDLGDKGSIIVYHETYEKGRIKDLIQDFPQYKKQLEPLLDRVVDLEKVFKYHPDDQFFNKKGDPTTKPQGKALTLVYNHLMGNSCSIKYVGPALSPNRADLDYHNLDQVHHGEEAVDAYKKLKDLKGKERDTLVENMLKYCCLDTKSMVVVYLRLLELVA